MDILHDEDTGVWAVEASDEEQVLKSDEGHDRIAEVIGQATRWLAPRGTLE